MRRLFTAITFFLLSVVSIALAFSPVIVTMLPFSEFAGLNISIWLIIIGIVSFFIGGAIAVTTGDAMRKERDRPGRKKLESLQPDTALSYEKVEPLTENDRAVLKKEFLLLMIVLGVFALAPLGFLFFMEESNRIFIYIFMLPWISMLLYFGNKGYERKQSIFETGTKNVIRGVITDRFYKYHEQGQHLSQSERSTISIPHFRIGDRELWVSRSIFGRFKVGDAVEFHYCETGIAFGHQTNVFLKAMVVEIADDNQ